MATEQVALMHRKNHLPDPVPAGLSAEEQKAWNYQSFIRNYLRCVASIDENVGRVLDFLDENQLAEDTIVIYTSDHGFFLGDHGWYDKRFMYEESIRIPFLMRYPRAIQAGTTSERVALNVDFAPTILDYAGVAVPRRCRGEAFERSPKAGRLLTGALQCITAIGCTSPISISRPLWNPHRAPQADLLLRGGAGQRRRHR